MDLDAYRQIAEVMVSDSEQGHEILDSLVNPLHPLPGNFGDILTTVFFEHTHPSGTLEGPLSRNYISLFVSTWMDARRILSNQGVDYRRVEILGEWRIGDVARPPQMGMGIGLAFKDRNWSFPSVPINHRVCGVSCRLRRKR